MTETTNWKGRLRLGDYFACWSGSVGDATTHRHFAAQAVFSNEALTAIDAQGARRSGHCLLIEPDTPHRLLSAPAAELWFVEPTVGFGPPKELKDRLLGADTISIRTEEHPSFWEGWLTRCARPPLDPRITRAAASIDRLIPMGSVRLADVAEESGLSLGRFRHLFAAEIGMPFQRYVLWRRLLIAFDALSTGRNATEAAHLAGFSDSPHFARTIKAMFGIRASDLFIDP
ncbi:MAG: helix-turn-helix transcriptional regulator [Sphingopyxis sp.]|nr:helix-turn-helix transcriptional regulator [Sphingopyxis sp.]